MVEVLYASTMQEDAPCWTLEFGVLYGIAMFRQHLTYSSDQQFQSCIICISITCRKSFGYFCDPTSARSCYIVSKALDLRNDRVKTTISTTSVAARPRKPPFYVPYITESIQSLRKAVQPYP
jgi:hypothetical protein